MQTLSNMTRSERFESRGQSVSIVGCLWEANCEDGMKRASKAAVVAVLLGACSGVDEGPTSFVLTDSAGVLVVTSSNLEPVGGDWTVGLRPTVMVGSDEASAAEYQLHQVRGATRLSDGRLAILDGGSSELRVYTPAGEFAAAHAGLGEGPGELQVPMTLTRMAGDTLVVWDPGTSRLSWFEPTAGFVRTRVVDRAKIAGVDPGFSNGLAGVLTDGRLLIQMVEPRGGTPQPTVYRPVLGFGVLSMDLTTFDILGWYGGEERILLETERGPRTMPVLNARMTLHTVASHRSAICVGDQAVAAVACWGWLGRDRVEFRWPAMSRGLTESESESLRDGFRLGLGRRYTPEGQEQVLRDLPVMEAAPFFDQLLIDSTDHLWVFTRTSPENGEPLQAFVFNAERGLVASVALPGHRVLEIGSDYVVALERDHLGVESIAVYPLSRGG